MRSKKIFMTLLCSLFLFGCSKNEEITNTGATWYSGKEFVESNGSVGDFFFDIDDYNIYQKLDSGWTLISYVNGEDGKDGITPTISINSEGYWVINGITSTTKAEGLDGKDGKDGNGSFSVSINDNGYWVINGKTTDVRASAINGKNGKDGSTLITGIINPSNSTGNNDDFYLNTSSLELFKKIDGLWILQTTLKDTYQLKAKPVIFDTDFWTDIDDAIAIRILLWAEQEGMVDIAGMIVNAVNDNTAVALSRFLDYEGRGDLPFALEKDATTYGGSPSYFNTIINNWDTGMYESNDECEDENNGEYYIKLLKNIPEGEKCNIISVGYGSALSGLMNRAEQNEEIMNLVKTKIDKIYMMAGKYPNGSENNFTRAAKSRQAGYDICEKTPDEIPIIFLGYEQGESVKTGGTLQSVLGSDELLYKMLVAHGSGSGRSSWDPMLTLLAVYDNATAAGYNLIQGTNKVNASTGANVFTENTAGNHYYVTKRYNNNYYKHQIDSIIEKNAWPYRNVGRVQYDPVKVNYTLQSIDITTSPTKLNYVVGDTFSAAGMVVKATFLIDSTNTTKTQVITNYSYTPTTFSSTGTQYVVINYTFNGVTKSAKVAVNVTTPSKYSISVTNLNGTYQGETSIEQNSIVKITLSADTGYVLPYSVTVSGAAYTYDSVTGIITLSNATGNVKITAECLKIQEYPISVNITNGTSSGDTSIQTGGTAQIVIASNSGYVLPNSIIVSGASYNYNASTGIITLSNPTGNVSISVECSNEEYFVIILNGTENWAFNTNDEPNTYGFYNCYLIDGNIVPPASEVSLIETIYGDITSSDSRFATSKEPRQSTNQLSVGYFANDPSIYFRFDNSIATSVDSFKAWLAANPITVYIKKS